MLRTYASRKPATAPKASALVEKENAALARPLHQIPAPSKEKPSHATGSRNIKRGRDEDAAQPRTALGTLVAPATKRQKVVDAPKNRSGHVSSERIMEYLQMKRAEFEAIDKIEIPDVADSRDDLNISRSTGTTGDAVNREFVEISSIVGSISNFISMDTDSNAIEESGRDELPDSDSFFNITPLASSDDFDAVVTAKKPTRTATTVASTKNNATSKSKAMPSTANLRSKIQQKPATAKQVVRRSSPRVAQKMHQKQNTTEDTAASSNNANDLESFVFDNFIQPTEVAGVHEVASPSKDGDLAFFAATPAPSGPNATAGAGKRVPRRPAGAAAHSSQKNQKIQDAFNAALEQLVFDEFIQPK